MKAALLIVLSLSAVALAGPAFNKDNQIDSQESYSKQNTKDTSNSSQQLAKGPIVDVLKQWCQSSQMSQQELTASFKKLVSVIKSNPIDQSTEQAVMNERICSVNSVTSSGKQQQQQQSNTDSDAQAHELIKDVYMDALIACKSRDCTKQLLKLIEQQSDKVDTIRASYYMTRLAVTEKDQIKDTEEIKQLVESFTEQQRSSEESSDSVERQKLFAVTSMVGKYCLDKPNDSQAKQLAQQVTKTIVERYIKPVSQQDIEQYQTQSINNEQQQVSEQIVKKIAKRNAALKALANLPAHITKEISECEQQIMSIAQNKNELVTSRQSAIECLEQNDRAQQMLKQLTFDQEEPIEVRIAAYRALMTVVYSNKSDDAQKQQQIASQIIDEIVKHCEDSRNQQQDDQFVLYAISHLDNMRTSQQSEHAAIKECIANNKQHYMQIQVLCKKFKQQLSDVRRSSRNYKLEQEFNQIESGLILEGDLIYESKSSQYSTKRPVQLLPKLIRVNMSMPVMGKTVNVVEITVRQNQMDEELLSALKMVENTKFSAQTVSKVVDQFKSTVEKQQQQQQANKQQATECDLSIKVDGCTVVYLTVDDFKTTSSSSSQQHQRNTRSVYTSKSIVDDIVEYIKRSPVSFNRGINFSIDERIAKLLDVEANVIAGLRFESRAQGKSGDNFEIVAKVEPRFNFEAIVGPAKMSSKKLLQRLSTKTAMNLRLRFKSDELVDVQVDLPMQSMELFTVESQIVERNSANSQSYNYLPESIYGQEDIYSSYNSNKLVKRSIFDTKQESMVNKLIKGKRVQRSLETSEQFARATGLRANVRIVAAPKEMSLIVSAKVDKYEPSMQGYRMLIQKSPSSARGQKSYVVEVSTPGSRVNRQVSMTLYTQQSQQRTTIKSDVQVSDKLAVSFVTELVHDGRQYAVRSELVSRSHKQWRHFVDAGVMISGNSKSPSGRIAQVAYKPYVQLESSSLKRPIQLQGTIAYSQSPKSVISYELKCQTSGDYIQGKLIVDQRDLSGAYKMRKQTSNTYRLRRSMQSPLELVLSKELTMTNELVAQIRSNAVKLHQMIDWDAQKIALQADFSGSYKNIRDSSSSPDTVSAQLKLDTVQQMLTVERKSPSDERKQFRAQLKSDWLAPSSHQMLAEVRYNARREALVAYKHKIDINKISQKQFECQMQFELVDTERQINEKLSGRSIVSVANKQNSLQLELNNSGRQQVAKVHVDFESLDQHQVSVFVQTKSFDHKCELRNNQRQFVMMSRTDKHGQTLAKLVVEYNKSSSDKQCKIVVEVPVKRVAIAADLKLASGQRSSVAIQSARFVSSGEFSFETVSRNTKSFVPTRLLGNKWANLRFRHSLKDLESKQAYWMDSALNAGDWDRESSFLRFESPVYRTDIEFDPRDLSTKFGAFARSKRSIDDSQMYSNKHSSLNDFIVSHQSPLAELANKLKLDQNKIWMMRAVMSSPFARGQLKEQARRALVQYADRSSSHKHAFEWSPERVNFDLERSPNSDFDSSSSFEPLRVKCDLSSSFERPSSMSLDSEWMSAELETKPFGSDESYAKLSALSRHRRSPFKKHESEWRFNKHEGHKASMKHVDSDDKRHELRAQAERDPKKWAKMEFESDKHGKANWEHKWRKHVEKRNSHQNQDDEVYANKINFGLQSPKANSKQWTHETQFEWQEPTGMIKGEPRYRRSIVDSDSGETSSLAYSPIDYLKHTSARLASTYSMQPIDSSEPLYKLDFDYKPQLNQARLDVQMPNDLLHTSSFESKPTERMYKLQSKLYNRRTQEPSYDFSAQTKPYVASLATQDQEPVFVHTEHPMLERPISSNSMLYQLFKQPLKLDYSDKYGRQASFDYDQLPAVVGSSQRYAGLRQKRAALFYKDSDNDFEHSSSYDFYPETVLGRVRSAQNTSNNNNKYANMMTTDDLVIKTQTKFGPIVVRADTSDVDNMQCELESPIVKAKLVAESGVNMRKLIKLHLDNKSQRVQVSKLVRKYAPDAISQLAIVEKLARKVDSNRFEHDTELLISIVDSIFKIKSQTYLNSRQTVLVEGEWNEQQGKAFAKIDGEHAQGKCVIDLVRKSAELVMDLSSNISKHISEPIHHVTRIERTSNNFFKLDSITSYKSSPIFKLQGNIAAIVIEQPGHLFQNTRRRFVSSPSSDKSHVSTFEAFLYEPMQYHITGVYDCCDKKELRIVSKCLENNNVQETLVKFDEHTETIVFDSRLSSAYEGQVYTTKAKLNLPGLTQSNKCYRKFSSPNTCASELIYEDKSGVWATKYQPDDFVTWITPSGKQSIKLNY